MLWRGTQLFSLFVLSSYVCASSSPCVVLGHSSFIFSSCCFLLFLLPPLKYKKKKKCTANCVSWRGTRLFSFSLLLFVLLLPHVSCRSMALLYCWIYVLKINKKWCVIFTQKCVWSRCNYTQTKTCVVFTHFHFTQLKRVVITHDCRVKILQIILLKENSTQ